MTTFTYAEVGATESGGRLPGGYHHLDVTTEVGRGERDFAVAVEAVMGWRMHRAVGVGMEAATDRAAPGADVTVGLGPIKAPCRVIWTRDDDRAGGWAYGTLRGHPERGEEAFLVTLGEDGRVRLTVRAFSVAAAWYARLAGPVTRWLQHAYARRCGRILRGLVVQGS
ncbi:DUF1990 domain-containing protein [Streptomyces sp. N35]|uniref:DUF1990 domain-containing protein n=1 Tax=Streptomyces sp. N35 TaxID=2795730 RepID=UPI0018F79A4F|nr:DUF1990 domain-containing protein [Streptomyces sp. N35]